MPKDCIPMGENNISHDIFNYHQHRQTPILHTQT